MWHEMRLVATPIHPALPANALQRDENLANSIISSQTGTLDELSYLDMSSFMDLCCHTDPERLLVSQDCFPT